MCPRPDTNKVAPKLGKLALLVHCPDPVRAVVTPTSVPIVGLNCATGVPGKFPMGDGKGTVTVNVSVILSALTAIGVRTIAPRTPARSASLRVRISPPPSPSPFGESKSGRYV